MNEQELLNKAQQIVGDLSSMMNIDAKITYAIEASDDGDAKVIKVEFEGDDLGYMIGQHGRHLKALQYIVSLLINRELADGGDSTVYVNVDVGGYRRSRFDKIERIALQKAEDARILGDYVDMEPLPPAERRVVHMILSQFPDIRTESQGEAPDRFVRIIPVIEGASEESNADDANSESEADDVLNDEALE
ncbi:MAG: KH domain-containing protein [Candidatus Dojkabacteria bacterium]|nr:MAG: KH domain-containing protein [Candidatus Dojkabacteria bacterium]